MYEIHIAGKASGSTSTSTTRIPGDVYVHKRIIFMCIIRVHTYFACVLIFSDI